MKLTLKQRFRNWLMTDNDHYSDGPGLATNLAKSKDDSELNIHDSNCITFRVVPANGGRIVQVQYFDERQDRHYTKLHLVTPDEDLAQSLAQILHLETLSR